MNLRNQYNAALAGAGTRSGAADNEFYRRATEFDPYARVEQSAMGSYNLLADQLGKQMQTLRSQQVGMGRLQTGFASEDETDLVREGRDQLTNMLLANSMQAAQMDQSRIGMLGSYAGQQQSNYYDLLSGGLDREQAERNARQQKRGGLFGTIGAIGGALLGSGILPGVGTKLGAALGDKVGARLGAGLGGLLGNTLGSR
jgi:hypothetical protein